MNNYPEHMSQLYIEFIENRLHAEIDFNNSKDMELLFNLSNIFVEPSKHEGNRTCKACINRVLEKVRNAYPNHN